MQDRMNEAITLDIVIPVYNEANGIQRLVDRLNQVFSTEALEKNLIKEVHFLYVDDGSTDRTIILLGRLLKSRINWKIIRLSRNFGHQAAVSAGLEMAKSDLVAVMDADLQDPPELILKMIEKWREGHEVIFGQRKNREEGPVKKFFYWLFYRIYSFLSPVPVPLDSGDFCLMSRKVLGHLNRLPENIRFPRGLRSWVGFSQTGIPYDRPKREFGISKYHLSDLYNLATNGITSMSTKPLKLGQLLSFVYVLFSLVALVFLGYAWWVEETGSSKLLLAVTFIILFSNSIILFYLYILGAYIGRTYWETKGRPNYIVDEIISN